MTSKELRRKYIDFFVKEGHTEIPSASLVPENDASTLFVSAGMQPIVPFLMGEKHPLGNKLVNSQKCIRTGDIDEVGDEIHHTFFEMLGHWSLGDYFKQEAIKLSWEFLTQVLNLNKNRLAFSVFAGDENSSRDEEAAEAWKSLGVQELRIAYLSKKENWWEPDGDSGPCGPDTEMFYWTDDKVPAPEKFDPQDKNWVEIGNDVLMQYTKQGQNKYLPAKQKNIDNGTGLERLTAVLNNLDDNYLTDLFKPIIEKIEELSNKDYSSSFQDDRKSIRIVADHLRAVTFIMADDAKVSPSNVDSGYVVRKLIRRAIRHGRMLGIKENFTHTIGAVVVDLMNDVYPELNKNKNFILDSLKLEEEKFTKTLQSGLKEFSKLVSKCQSIQCQKISGKDAFNLFQTYGFPLELTQELAREKGIEVDVDGFNIQMKKHQDLSRTASVGKFKGGLANQSEKTIKYHTVAHLMLAALRQIFNQNIQQRGSNINEERLRFDFSYPEKLTDQEKNKIEELVNNWVKQDIEVKCEEMSLGEARQKNATGIFEDKYGETVKVYSIGDFSKEICGGPHVSRTGILGKFKIKKEESSSAGIRRIKAVLE
ncbi:MAG: alanine--tRNA ligase [Patescibacteria group bacterium]